MDRNTIIAAVISSIIVTVVFLIIGCCACGRFGHRFKNTAKARSDKNNSSQQPQPGPLYEDLRPTSMTEYREKAAFELKENAAYGLVHYTCNDYAHE